MKKLFFLFALIIILSGCIQTKPVACTMEAKLCPDGTAVGRSGPNCEFTKCPGEDGNAVCTKEAKLCPDGSTVGRTGPNCEFEACPAEAPCEGESCPKTVSGQTEPAPGGTAGGAVCTMDAKLCPDGSYVSRVAPNCEFSPCPGEGDLPKAGGDRDEHGCIGSAGYRWCEARQKCLRIWEEDCPGLIKP